MRAGSPRLSLRICARERSFEFCSGCPDLVYDKFEWLGDHGTTIKSRLKDSKDETKKDLIEKAFVNVDNSTSFLTYFDRF